MTRVNSKKIYRSLLFAVALLLMTHGFFLRGLQAGSSTTVDFFNIWGVIEYVRGAKPLGTNIYSPEIQYEMADRLRSAASSSDSPLQKAATEENLDIYGGRLDSIASPFMYTFISALSSGNYHSSHAGYVWLCLSTFLLSMLMLGRTLKFSWTAIFFLTFLFLELYSPLISDLRVGNVNCIQLLAVSIYIYLSSRSKRFLSGVVLVLCVMLKPTTVMIVFVAAVDACFQKPFREQCALFAGMFSGFAVGSLAPLALFPNLAVWGDFIRSLPATLEMSRYPLENGNMGLIMLVNHLSGMKISLTMYLLLLPLVLFSLYRSSSCRGESCAGTAGEQASIRVVGYGAVIMLCSSSLVWLHYYTILIPVLLYALRPELWRSSVAAAIAPRIVAVAAFLLFSTPVEQFMPDNAAYAMVLNGVVLSLAALLAQEKLFFSGQSAAEKESIQ